MGRERGILHSLLITALIAAGCARMGTPEEKEVICRISIEDTGYAVKAMDPDENMISDVSIMIFDERGEAEECLWLPNGETSAEIPLVLGKTYSFRACANFGYRTFADHISELDVAVGENQNGGRHSRIRLEHARRHRNHSLQLLIFYQFMADCLMRLGGTKENTIRDNAGASTTDFEHLCKQHHKEQFGFSGLTQSEQIFADFLLEHAAGKRRVRHDKGILIPFGILTR